MKWIRILPAFVRHSIYSLIDSELDLINEKTIETFKLRVRLAIQEALGLAQ
jgi:hypothetical protein